MRSSERIVLDPEVLAGKPVIRGTRLAVELVLERLAAGQTEQEVLASYPGLTHDDVLACLAHARDQVRSARHRLPAAMADADALRLFNEKVEALVRTDVGRVAPQASMRFRRGQGWTQEYSGPEDLHVEAAALSLRFFIQDNEATSFRNMAQRYAGMPVADGLKVRFNAVRDELNAFLDSESNWAIEEGRKLTYSDIRDLFLYGSLAHANSTKRNTLLDLGSTPFYSGIRASFMSTLTAHVRAVALIRDINDEALSELEALKRHS